MMNKYIRIVMTPTKCGIGGSFTTVASFKLDNILSPFSNVQIKIDTGCSISTIPLARFKALNSLCDKLKYDDISKNVFYVSSYGVETGGKEHSIPITDDEKIKCEALKFKHIISDFNIAGVPLLNNYMFVNYNRKGNILIGMDILKDWDIHMGTISTGETIFLACPKEKINDEYLLELERTFGIGKLTNSALLR